jgi:hypothetical protein
MLNSIIQSMSADLSVTIIILGITLIKCLTSSRRRPQGLSFEVGIILYTMLFFFLHLHLRVSHYPLSTMTPAVITTPEIATVDVILRKK